MNRSQRRKLEREQGKEVAQYNAQAKWLDTLLPWQKKVIDKMLREAKVDAEIECIEAVDKILTGVLFERTDMNWQESFEFNSAFGKYYAEYRFVVSKYGKEKRLKMLQELETEIVSKIENWITEEKSKVQIIKQIRADYKGVGLVTPEINNVYQRTYENYKNYIKEVEPEIIEKIIKYLNDNQKSEGIINLLKIEYPKISDSDLRGLFILGKDEFMKPKYDDYSNIPYKGAEAEKKAKDRYKEKKKQCNSEKEDDSKEESNGMGNLKVVREITKVISRELKGEFGKYIADENGVTREDITFKGLAAVEIYKKEQLEKFEREIAELQAVFEFVKE